MPDDAPRVTILGAGIIGICTALSLLERGLSVRVIDRGPPGQETSMGNAGVISPWSIIPQSLPGTWRAIPKLMFGFGRPLSIQARALPRMIPWGMKFIRQGNPASVEKAASAMSLLCGPSIDMYRRHLQGTGFEHLVRDSMYVHAFRDGSRANLQQIDYRIRTEMGADLELVGRDRLADLEPALSPEFQAAVLIKGQARALSPGKIGEVLASKAQSSGAEFVRDTVSAIQQAEDGWRVVCKDGNYRASKIVVSMGAWSADLLKSLGIEMPLMAERGYHVQFPEPNVEVQNSVMDVAAKVVASSMQDGLRVAGQAEFAPVDAPPNHRRETQLIAVARAMFPALSVNKPRLWMGRRPSFPDSLPVIEHARKFDGLYLNFGHSHYGLMMAPKSGELMAQIVNGERPNIELEAFSSRRF